MTELHDVNAASSETVFDRMSVVSGSMESDKMFHYDSAQSSLGGPTSHNIEFANGGSKGGVNSTSRSLVQETTGTSRPHHTVYRLGPNVYKGLNNGSVVSETSAAYS